LPCGSTSRAARRPCRRGAAPTASPCGWSASSSTIGHLVEACRRPSPRACAESGAARAQAVVDVGNGAVEDDVTRVFKEPFRDSSAPSGASPEALGVEFGVLGLVLGLGFWVSSSEPGSWNLVLRPWYLALGTWYLVLEVWDLAFGFRFSWLLLSRSVVAVQVQLDLAVCLSCVEAWEIGQGWFKHAGPHPVRVAAPTQVVKGKRRRHDVRNDSCAFEAPAIGQAQIAIAVFEHAAVAQTSELGREDDPAVFRPMTMARRCSCSTAANNSAALAGRLVHQHGQSVRDNVRRRGQGPCGSEVFHRGPTENA